VDSKNVAADVRRRISAKSRGRPPHVGGYRVWQIESTLVIDDDSNRPFIFGRV